MGAASARAWRQANPDRSRAQSKAWRLAHPDRLRAAADRYAVAHRDRLLEAKRAWARRNADRLRVEFRKWRAANPERLRELWRAWAKTHRQQLREKARARGSHPSLRWLLRRRPELKAICAIGGGPAHHADHLRPVSRGGTDALDNLRPLCARHNLARGAARMTDRQLAAIPCGP